MVLCLQLSIYQLFYLLALLVDLFGCLLILFLLLLIVIKERGFRHRGLLCFCDPA